MNTIDITKTISMALSEVMTSEGIVKNKQAEYIRNIIGISSVQAHRKLNGTVPWDIKQLEKMLLSLNNSLSNFFLKVERNEYQKVQAKLLINGVNSNCLIYLSNESNSETAVAAVKINNDWKIISTTEIKKNIEIYNGYKSIKLIEPLTNASLKKKTSLVILDDDINIVEFLTKELNTYEIDIEGYTKLDELNKKILNSPAEIYILDWLIGTTTVFNSIRKIRESQKPNALIIVLTGQCGDVVDSEILTAIKEYYISSPLEKPVRLPILKHYLDRYLEAK